MSTSSASESRRCPECGTRNSGLSLFCAECGAALYNDAPGTNGDDATQATTVFTTSSDPNATAEFTPRTSSTQETLTSSPAWSAAEPVETWAAATTPPSDVVFSPPESRRGLVLGWIAAALIALVIGFLIWSSFLSAGTRDMVTGWFS
ncbi:MAG TPA: hypothetical protein VM450_11850 [Thermomicrobiales bacterium]|nr:hypothetical protein [Thermomicrobiales bacterium]